MRKIFIIDGETVPNPEDNAMLQALYSRSSQSVENHLEKVHKLGSGKFMSRYYVGYGHKSIADCGTTTIYLEGVSMLAAKAIQDWQLYSGQESSTRYIDFNKQGFVTPQNNTKASEIQQKFIDFYLSSLDKVKSYIADSNPRKEGVKKTTYKKAIEARAFDILRSFLPAGTKTQLSWHTNLRQAYDKLKSIQYHPLQEVRDICKELLFSLSEKYPNSFGHKANKEREEFYRYISSRYTYQFKPIRKGMEFETDFEWSDIAPHRELLSSRPEKCYLPNFLSRFGMCRFSFNLDYGSFRDLQRHRNGICEMPLLTLEEGFSDWYLQQLPVFLREDARSLLFEQAKEIDQLDLELEELQYCIPMGFKVPVHLAYGLGASIYIMELRSTPHVHPTLRKQIHRMYYLFNKKFPAIKVHVDLSEDEWSFKRGEQDITEIKNENQI